MRIIHRAIRRQAGAVDPYPAFGQLPRSENVATWPGYPHGLSDPWGSRAATYLNAFAAEGDRLEALALEARIRRAWKCTPATIRNLPEAFAAAAAAAQACTLAWAEWATAWNRAKARQELAIAQERVYVAREDTGAADSKRKWFE